jgi:hypothetical protein
MTFSRRLEKVHSSEDHLEKQYKVKMPGGGHFYNTDYARFSMCRSIISKNIRNQIFLGIFLIIS